ncbi:MAG: L,D-transpeptidase [Thermoleophilia bacterium]
MTRIRPAALPGAAGVAAACALAAVSLVGPSAVAGPDSAAAAPAKVAPTPIASRPTTREAWTARILLPVHARSAPTAKARKISKLSPLAPYNKQPQSLLVVNARSTVRDGVWYQVLLPSRPNDAVGWVPDDAVRVKKTPYRVLVDLSDRTTALIKAGRTIATFPSAVGTSANPTPEGRFALSESVKQRPANGFFGTYILTLTAHSESLNEFDGGDGRVALHGTSQPQLLGQAVSHGCVRLSNAAATRIAKTVPPGAPVDIVE